VGFDVNPLAVTVARAELVLAYRRASGKEPENPPHVYHADTFAMWFGGHRTPAVELEELAKKAWDYFDILKDSNVVLKLYGFDFDVFQHGILPAVVIMKRVGK